MVRRLRRGSRVAQLHTARQLVHSLDCQPPKQAEQQAAFLAAGGLPAGLQLLQQSGMPAVRVQVTWMLSLAVKYNTEACRALIAAGGAAVLTRQLQDSIASGNDYLVGRTCAALAMAATSKCPEVANAIAAAGAVPLVVSRFQHCGISGKTPPCSAVMVGILAKGGPSCSAAAAASGAVEALVQLLRRSNCSDVQQDAMLSLGTLADLSAGSAEAAAAAGAIPVVVQLLGSIKAGTQQRAAELLGTWALVAPHIKPAIAEAGGLAALERLLPSSSGKVEEAIDLIRAPDPAAEEPQPEHSSDSALQHATDAGPSTPAPPTPARHGRPPRMCAAPGCGAASSLKLCAGCHAVRYCSVECSLTHWPEHKAKCRRLQAERVVAAAEEPAAANACAEPAE